jgi:hypothetical protein
MGESAQKVRRVPGYVKAGGALVAGWALLLVATSPLFDFYHRLVALARGAGWLRLSGEEAQALHDVLCHSQDFLQNHLLLPLVFGATLAVPLGMLVRMVARARTRAGLADPLDRVRNWTAAHPKATSRLLALPALLWCLRSAIHVLLMVYHWRTWSYGTAVSAGGEAVTYLHGVFASGMGAFLCLFLAVSAGVYKVTRAGFGALLAPTTEPLETTTHAAEDRIQFDAVAVTTETRAAVGAMALLPVMTLFAINAARLGSAGTEIALGAYVALALGGALAFRRASKIRVGVDGVFVTGSSRTRFFAYKDLDEARATGSALELLQGDSVVLRLQLHGEDATKRGAILERICEAIARSKQGRDAAAARVVESVSGEALARLAQGGGDYRAPALTREQLWALVEGPEHDARIRTASAEALASTGDRTERARLRVAAGQCAEPDARTALEDLATEDGDLDEDEPFFASRRVLRASR